MDQRHKDLMGDGDKLFDARREIENLWQEIALHFHPQMADITSQRSLGEDFAEHLTTSYPVIVRRTLGDSISAMLRPATLDTTSPGVWFSMSVEEEAREDTAAMRWLEWATGVQRRAMYDRVTRFTRSTKEADHNFVTFGNAPMSVKLNRNRDALLYQTWHIRDVVWQEDAEGEINQVHRKWRPSVLQLYNTFGKKCAPSMRDKLAKDPHATVECRHIMIRTEDYVSRNSQNKKFNQPWVSIWLDRDHDHMLEEVGSRSKEYIIPRWMTLPASQYGYSPAVVAALPDARLIQAMTLTLLEAGERYADPPMVATQETVRSDLQMYAGGVTWVDATYDERLGAAIRPAYDVRGGEGLRYAIDMAGGVQQSIAKAFYLDSLSLPPADTRDMTAFEVGQRISEWIRRAMPIFEPIEFDYNGQLCEETFDILLHEGAFGSVYDMPTSLRGADIRFRFESPLHESADRRKGQKFLESKAMLMEAAEIDQTLVPMLDARIALRDTLKGIGVPTDWTRDDMAMEEIVRGNQQAAQAAQAMAGVQEAASTTKDLGAAARDFAAAETAGQGV